MSSPAHEPWNEVLKTVLARTATDASYRAKCLADAAVAVRELTGQDGPAGLRFVEAPDGAGIVLPPFAGDPDEISEDEMLSAVVGGASGMTPRLTRSYGNGNVCNP